MAITVLRGAPPVEPRPAVTMLAMPPADMTEELEQPSAAARSIFAAAIFLGAFLLFQVQLILGKFLLPWFGGTSAVWATCMLFFQLLLLAGYAYAHWLARKDGRLQWRIHSTLLAISALLLCVMWMLYRTPLLLGAAWKPAADAPPAFTILLLLSVSVGVPFFTLSSTAPLLQRWYSKLFAGDSAYALYALSNLGSLLGLLSYPLLVEPVWTLRAQARVWAVLFVFFALLCARCAWNAKGISFVEPAAAPASTDRLAALWVTLAFCGSTLMLAGTNRITHDVAPVPLFWVLPLAIYLVTFIVAFENERWYRREVFHPLLVVALIFGAIALYRATAMDISGQLAVTLFVVFSGCMVCHGELARLKPEAARLTRFYFFVSLGGAMGGIFVGLIAPNIFPAVWEYHIALGLTALLLSVVLFSDRTSWYYESKPWLPFVFFSAVAAVPLYLRKLEMVEFPIVLVWPYWIYLTAISLAALWLAMSGGPRWMHRPEFRWNQMTVTSALVLLLVTLIWHIRQPVGKVLHETRNFYGSLQVLEQNENSLDGLHYIELVHGGITHGLQLQAPGKKHIATAYYNLSSGAGLAIISNPRRLQGKLRVGAVGLGIGTLATYGRDGDYFRFYEINPTVIEMARSGEFFTFVKNSRAQVEIIPGDARLSLEAEAARGELQKFDVLVVDAFNGDSIPVHLLTVEAMQTYLKHLRSPDAVVAIHISNLAVDLQPVVAGLADHFDMDATLITSPEQNTVMLESDWILLSKGDALRAPEITAVGMPMMRTRMLLGQRKKPPLWTDDHSNIVRLLK